ncbi:sirohydrochlorin chelatase [Yinghuangia soli]|uniref:Sirohydrochlorin chelatase n=1 Tax=Yinghuangia soli TaxID=2908204 RepID=A0AA41U4Z5_9ACTN|nr:CbiX/SirB N-terminal domain-containing protein [Yinghuangia soli]MCF2529484.1 sirohydrochlorin chelatase [Yinghuangia soli]
MSHVPPAAALPPAPLAAPHARHDEPDRYVRHDEPDRYARHDEPDRHDLSDPSRLSAASGPRVPLLAVAHGTRDAAGLAATAALVDEIRALRPGLAVELAYVDVAEPLLADTLARMAGPVVLVPLLLGAGYHVREDIPAALAAAPHVQARIAGVLGPDPLLAEVLGERLAAAWAGTAAEARDAQDHPQAVDEPGDSLWTERLAGCEAIVLAAAGSTDPGANADAARMAALLGALTGRPVVPSYLCAGAPTPAEAVAALHADGVRNVAVSGYLMSPGYFARKAAGSGAAATADPLGAHPALARLALARYDEALAQEASAAEDAQEAHELRQEAHRN